MVIYLELVVRSLYVWSWWLDRYMSGVGVAILLKSAIMLVVHNQPFPPYFWCFDYFLSCLFQYFADVHSDFVAFISCFAYMGCDR